MFIMGTIRKNAEVRSRRRTGLPRRFILCALALLTAASLLHAQDISEVQSRADAWIARSKETYRLDCNDMQQIWAAYCSEGDVTVERDRGAARDVANRMKDDAQPAIQRQLDAYDRLRIDAERLKTGSTESQATKILDAIKVEYERLTRLGNGFWRGASNPLIQYAIEYGKKQHEDMGGSSTYHCDVVDKEYPGSNERPDCVSARECTVFEFKPDNSRAESKGNDQLRGYVPLVNDYYSNKITRKDTPKSELGGSDIIKYIHENKSCYEGNWPEGGDPIGEIKTKFKGRVATYRPCENTYRCTIP
jgi:hypothetical protein